MTSPEVTTTSGVVRGASSDGVTHYLGVPYAAAPVGELRFLPPQPAPTWEGVRDATTPGATAPQTPYSGGMEQLLGTVTVPGDEWLNLTVYAPDDAVSAPVMVWIHGGSLSHGANSLDGYNGTQFARDGIVFVAINYRLGTEGFSVLEGAELNLGILDQLAALEWVQQNIAAFGGDPARVTVFGQSAGGQSVAVILAQPQASRLISRAVIMSGPLMGSPAKRAGRITRLIAKRLGIPATRDAFATKTPAELIEAQRAVTEGATPLSGGPAFGLAVGDGVAPKTPEESLTAGAGIDIPLLIGTTTEEHRLWVVPTGLDESVSAVHFSIARIIFRISGRALSVYKRNRPGIPRGELFGVLATDVILRLPAYRLADARARLGGTTHVYEFAWKSPVQNIGAAHAVELGFVFDRLHSPDSVGLGGADAPQSLATEMHSVWVRFAQGEEPEWPAWNADRPVRMFDVESTTVLSPREDERASWT